jgi:FtsH-binding integral membrane protein
MIKFIIGIILYTAGVFLAVKFAAEINEEKMKDAMNIIYGGLAGILIGVILSIWGFIDATTPKVD